MGQILFVIVTKITPANMILESSFWFWDMQLKSILQKKCLTDAKYTQWNHLFDSLKKKCNQFCPLFQSFLKVNINKSSHFSCPGDLILDFA